MSDRILTQNDLQDLSEILRAAGNGSKVTWQPDFEPIHGVVRHIVKDPDHAYFLGPEDDVRDGYLRISATFEHFIPIADILKFMHEGRLAFHES